MKKILFLLSCVWFSVNLGWLYWEEMEKKNLLTDTALSNPVYQERTYDVIFRQKRMASLVFSSFSSPLRQVRAQLSFNFLWDTIRQKLNIEVSAYADSGNKLSRFFITVWNTSKKEKISLNFFGRVTEKHIQISFSSFNYRYSFNVPIQNAYDFNSSFLLKSLFEENTTIDNRKMILSVLDTIRKGIAEIKLNGVQHYFLDYLDEILKNPPRIIMSKLNEIIEIKFSGDLQISEADIALDYKPYFIEIKQDILFNFMSVFKPLYNGTIWDDFLLNKLKK